jgi:hypothetical protein
MIQQNIRNIIIEMINIHDLAVQRSNIRLKLQRLTRKGWFNVQENISLSV